MAKEKRKKKTKKVIKSRVPGKVYVLTKKSTLNYEIELKNLQEELLIMQNYVKEHGLKVLMIFEGRDASGKGGTIKRITEHLSPVGTRVVALQKPTDLEKTQWYFQRYNNHLPSAGEIVLFDRSWYNRAGVEPVMGYCTEEQHREFLKETPEFERMLVKSGTILLKYYFSVSKEEQNRRFESRKTDPLKRHKLSPVDIQAQAKWNDYTMAKLSMLINTDTEDARWTIIRSDDKKKARLECIKHALRNIPYHQDMKKKLLIGDDNIRIHGKKEIEIMNKDIAKMLGGENKK